MNNECVSGEDQISFEDLYINYETDIFLYAHHSMNLSEEEAHDVKNEAFLTLLKVWRDFKPKTYPSAVSFLRKTVQFLSYNLSYKEPIRHHTYLQNLQILFQIRHCQEQEHDRPAL